MSSKKFFWRQKPSRDANRISERVRKKKSFAEATSESSNKIRGDLNLRSGVQLPEEGGTALQRL